MAGNNVISGLFRPRTTLGVAVGLTGVRGLRLAPGDREIASQGTAESLFPLDRQPSPHGNRGRGQNGGRCAGR